MSLNLAGGFVPYSPPPSSVASSHGASSLPQTRSSPLKPGGTKESRLIRYVDQRLLHIQRRFAKRDPSLRQEGVKEMDEEGRMIEQLDDPTTQKISDMSEEWHDVQGYATFGEAARDVEELLGVVWVSGTPALQTPYFAQIALLTNSMIAGFPASPRPLFRLLGKLDHVFASLLQGKDAETGELLSGFNTGRGVSGTEKVRIKSLVERTRVAVVDAMSKGGFEEDEDEEEKDHATEDTDMEGGLMLDDEPADLNVDDVADDDWDVMVAKVYDKTLMELGDTMNGPEIGIRTE